jgi:hypothetical protein
VKDKLDWVQNRKLFNIVKVSHLAWAFGSWVTLIFSEVMNALFCPVPSCKTCSLLVPSLPAGIFYSFSFFAAAIATVLACIYLFRLKESFFPRFINFGIIFILSMAAPISVWSFHLGGAVGLSARCWHFPGEFHWMDHDPNS